MLSFFPLDVLDEIWDLTESVSGGFLTYSSIAGYNPSLLFCIPNKKLSILYSCGDIFDEKCGEKEKKDIYKEE